MPSIKPDIFFQLIFVLIKVSQEEIVDDFGILLEGCVVEKTWVGVQIDGDAILQYQHYSSSRKQGVPLVREVDCDIADELERGVLKPHAIRWKMRR